MQQTVQLFLWDVYLPLVSLKVELVLQAIFEPILVCTAPVVML